MPVTDLVFDDANPRQRTERNLAAIRASIDEHGQVEPVLVQAKTGRVIHGNGRLMVMVEAGFTDVDCAVVDVDDGQARRLSIVLNRAGELAGWNTAILGGHLDALGLLDTSFDPASLGFTGTELEDLLDDVAQTIDDIDMEQAPDPEQMGVSLGMVDSDFETIDGIKPDDVPVSNVRLVQLILTDETIDQFNADIRAIANEHGLSNVTEVVKRVVADAAGAL